MNASHDDVRDHYQAAITDREGLLARLSATTGATGGPVTAADLARLDQFHFGGLAATAELARHAGIGADTLVLDAGCGLGGPSRYLAATFGCHVSGIDLAPDYVAIARWLTDRAGLTALVTSDVGDLTNLPFDGGRFDVVWTQHVVMNIPDRAGLYRELRRVVKTGGRLAFYDPIAADDGSVPYFPVPWAETASASTLLTRAATVTALEAAGFAVTTLSDVSTDALGWAARQQSAAAPAAATAATLAAVMGGRMAAMAANFARSVSEHRVRLMMGVCAAV